MEILKSYFVVTLRLLLNNRIPALLSALGFVLAITFFLVTQESIDRSEKQIAEEKPFEIWRLFDSPPTNKGHWDEFATFLSIKRSTAEQLKVKDDVYDIIQIVKASEFDASIPENIIYASDNFFKMMGVETPKKAEFYTCLDIDHFELNGYKYQNPSKFRTLNKISPFAFDIILPIETLPKTFDTDKLINVFLLTKPGFIATQVDDLLITKERLYPVKLWLDNFANLNLTNARDLYFNDVKSIIKWGLLVLAFLNMILMSNTLEASSQKEIAVRKGLGDGLKGLFIRQLFLSIILIFSSLLIALIITLPSLSIVITLIAYLLIGSTISSFYLALKQNSKSVYQIANNIYSTGLQPIFINSFLAICLSVGITLLIFTSQTKYQTLEMINSKISPYEYNEIIVDGNSVKLDSSRIFEQVASLDLNNAQENDIILAYNNYQDIFYQYNILNLILSLVVILIFIGTMIYLDQQLKFEIAVIRMSGAKFLNTFLFQLRFFIPIFILTLLFSWISGFFMSSGWLSNFADKAQIVFYPYYYSAISALIFLAVLGLVSSARIQKQSISQLLKNI